MEILTYMQFVTSKSYNLFPVSELFGTGTFAYMPQPYEQKPNFPKSGSMVERISGVAPERLGERLLLWSNDYAPERLGKSTRTIFNFNTMLALAIFYAAMLLPPFIIKWIDKCNSENTDNK